MRGLPDAMDADVGVARCVGIGQSIRQSMASGCISGMARSGFRVQGFPIECAVSLMQPLARYPNSHTLNPETIKPETLKQRNPESEL